MEKVMTIKPSTYGGDVIETSKRRWLMGLRMDQKCVCRGGLMAASNCLFPTAEKGDSSGAGGSRAVRALGGQPVVQERAL